CSRVAAGRRRRTLMSEAPVKRRRVHYFSGFDPRGPAHYHRLCREEAARPQPQGGVLRVGAREKVGPHNSRWRVHWRAQADAPETVETEHVFMGWDDRIRAHWARTPWALVREFFFTYRGIALGVGPLRARALSRTAFLTGVLPAVFLLLSALAGVAVGLLAAVLGTWPVLAVLLGAGTTAALVAWGASAGLFWLLRIFHFIIR